MWAGRRLHTIATSICSSVTGYHPLRGHRLLCTRRVYVKTLPCHLLLHHNCTCTQSNCPSLYICWEHTGHWPVEEIHTELTVQFFLWVASYPEMGWEDIGRSREKHLLDFQLWEAVRAQGNHSPLSTLSLPFCHIPFRDMPASLLVGSELHETRYVNALQTVKYYETQSIVTTMVPTVKYTRALGQQRVLFALPASMPGSVLAHWIPVVFRQQVTFCLVPRNDHDWFKGVLETLSLLCWFETSMWAESHLWHQKWSIAGNGSQSLWRDIPHWYKKGALGGNTLLLLPAQVLPRETVVLGTAAIFWHRKGEPKATQRGWSRVLIWLNQCTNHLWNCQYPHSLLWSICWKKKKNPIFSYPKAQGEKRDQAEGVLASKLSSLPSCFYLLCLIVGHSENYNN